MAKAAKPPTKSEVYSEIAQMTELSRKQVAGVFDALASVMKKYLKKSAFAVPSLMKVIVVNKPASPGGTRPDPFHPGQMMEVKPKPARKVVKVRALKNLKDMVK